MFTLALCFCFFLARVLLLLFMIHFQLTLTERDFLLTDLFMVINRFQDSSMEILLVLPSYLVSQLTWSATRYYLTSFFCCDFVDQTPKNLNSLISQVDGDVDLKYW